MAVQAQYPSNALLPSYRNRLPSPSLCLGFFLPMFFLFWLVGIGNWIEQCGLQVQNRERETERQKIQLRIALQQHQHQQVLNVADYRSHATGGPMVIPPPSTRGVSTGLHLTFEDDQLNSTSSASTSGRGNISSPLLYIVGEDLSTQIQQESEEIKLLFKAQGEQVCQLLEEKRQQHSRALLAAIEEGISRHFRAKDLEMENVKRQNLELAEHVKQLSIKVHNWQAKARANEAMVTALKSNLQQAQQAVALSLEQSKEGCGDSEADDAASSHHGDDDAHARTFKENRELREQRTCRVCRCNDVSILLLPCRHLCLCKECEARLDACPLCRSLKNASVQVYMS
ncbi:unnamed protein product [Sphagnum jensenii]|uniref:RING-type domain-containing protein n=1 Tax=Sphagnum jensenii TaxID=128206 RepID=A0ABP1ALZ1_9BRYO